MTYRNQGARHDIVVAARWLGHPVTMVALALWLVNDHLLKAASPGLVTGKLSDVAGLTVLPPVVCFVLCALVPRVGVVPLAAGAVAGTGCLFVLCKASELGAELSSTALSMVAGPSIVRADPTDLLMLPGLAVAWWAFGRGRHSVMAGENRRVQVPSRILLVLPIAVLATTATSAQMPSRVQIVGHWQGQFVAGDLSALLRSPDGHNPWTVLTPAQAREEEHDFVASPRLRVQKCLAVRAVCYRAIVERKAVEPDPDPYSITLDEQSLDAAEVETVRVDQSTDGSDVWETVWRMDPGRYWFVSRAHGVIDEVPYAVVRPYGLEVLPAKHGRHRVVVAMGADGLLVRDGNGGWQRTGIVQVKAPPGQEVPSDANWWEQPYPFTKFGANISPELFTLLGVTLLLWCAAMGWVWKDAPPGQRAFNAPRLAWAFCSVFMLGLAWKTPIGPLLDRSSLLVVLAFFALLFGLLTLGLGRRHTVGRRSRLLVHLATATLALAAIGPFLGWSIAMPDNYSTARTLALATGIPALALLLLATMHAHQKTAMIPAASSARTWTPGV